MIFMKNKSDQYYKDLMKSVQLGDRTSYDTLLIDLTQLLERYLSKKIFHADFREDILQEVLLAVHQARHTYVSDRPFLAWFFAIVRYKIADYIRSFGRQKGVIQSDFDLEAFPGEEVSFSNQLEDVYEVLDHLKPSHKEVFLWLKLDGYSMKEVAHFLNKSESAMKVMAHRIYHQIREMVLIYLVFSHGSLVTFIDYDTKGLL